MALDLVCTHQLAYPVGGTTVVDALGWANGPDGNVARFFVPAFVPCGECPLCRRGLVGACPTGTRFADVARPVGERPEAGRAITLPERFVAAIDEPAGVAALPDEVAVMAGVVAFALHAVAAASLAPGDVALWLGDGPVAAAGIALCRARDASTFAVGADAAALAAQLAQPSAAAVSTHGSRKRVLFLTEPGSAAWSSAVALGEPGSTFVALGDRGGRFDAPLVLPAETRLLLLSTAHPDFVPEALAALRRPELQSLRERLLGTPASA
jgi:D-arabinose 1-dehydrogenase-like Zn-dependent alcohol dehydrogenase